MPRVRVAAAVIRGMPTVAGVKAVATWSGAGAIKMGMPTVARIKAVATWSGAGAVKMGMPTVAGIAAHAFLIMASLPRMPSMACHQDWESGTAIYHAAWQREATATSRRGLPRITLSHRA